MTVSEEIPVLAPSLVGIHVIKIISKFLTIK